MHSLLSQPAGTIVEAIQSKVVSSEEITLAFIEQIEQINPVLNAVIQFNPDLALRQAKEADQRLMKGEATGPLHGLPITIKDTIDIFDYHNSYGSHLYDNYTPKQEGTCVTRLRQAGAIILGLTNSPELLTAYESDNLLYGRTNNPYNTQLSSGGSSGGEAAIIAANGSPLGLGTDGGGSIRLPAHYCGITGLKPTQGLIPKTGIALPGAGAGCLQAFGTCGPMARFVDDLILALPILSGPDGHDPDTPAVVLGDPNRVDIKRLKVAYFTDNGIAKPDQDIIDTLMSAVNAFVDMGAIVEEARPPSIERTMELHWEPFFLLGDGGRNVNEFCAELPAHQISNLRKHFNADAKRCHLDSAELNQRFAEIAAFKWSTYAFLNQYDLLICPPCATTAKPHGACLDQVKDFTYTMAFNNTGSPAAVVNCGKSKQGMPIGIQLVANLWRDHTVLAAAKFLEGQMGGWQMPNLNI